MSWIETVRGRVPAEEIGFTLPHEHTAVSLWHIANRWDYWELRRDEETIIGELGRYRDAGGTCLVDVTLPGIGRDPAWLRHLSERTGLHIVMGSGWYRLAYYPPDALIHRRTVDDLAEELVREVKEGVGSTGIRPGIIGEIGTDKPWVEPAEERVHRAAARAARATGRTLTTHGVQSDVGLAQLRIFEEEGVDPARVIIGHADSNPSMAFHEEILRRGANLQFDFLGMTFTPLERHGEPRLLRLLLELVARGHEDRILLSQDVCHDAQLTAYGGNGYTYLQDTFLPRLREAGVGQPTLDTITIENPRRLLSFD